MENYDVHEMIGMQPDPQVGVTAILPNLGKTRNSKKPTITLVGQRSGYNMEVKW